MECAKCKFRSAVGYCGVTHELLCEECGVHCDQCGMFVDQDLIYETHKGVKLCPKCQEERKTRKSEKKKKKHHHHREHEEVGSTAGGDTSLAALDDESSAREMLEEEEEEVPSDEALTTSGYQKWEPWQFSMLLAVFGVIGATLIIVFPSFRGITLGDGSYFPMAYIVVFLPLLSFVWAFIGLTYAKFWEDREKCLASSGLAILSIVMLFGSWFTDPVRYVERQSEIPIRTRDDMNSDELAEWREGVLNRYR